MNCERNVEWKREFFFRTFYVAVGNNAKYIWGISISGWTCRTVFEMESIERKIHFFIRLGHLLTGVGWMTLQKSENKFSRWHLHDSRLNFESNRSLIEMNLRIVAWLQFPSRNFLLHFFFLRWTLNVNFPDRRQCLVTSESCSHLWQHKSMVSLQKAPALLSIFMRLDACERLKD